MNLPGGFTVPIADYFEPDMVSATDYYPFGMVSRGVGPSDKYRFGFNGKENDNEVKGFAQQQDYGMRVYDPRVGRFLSVDPLTRNFAWNTPYAFAENSPIKFIDLDGAEKSDPSFKPTGITHIQRATVPIHPVEARTDYSIKAGPYQLFPVTDPSGKRNSYWLARYTYTEGPYAGLHRDDWIVGVDGVFDFVKKGKEYYNRAGWIEMFGGADQSFNLSSMWEGYKGVVSNPINWIGGAGILAASYKGLLRGTLSDVEARKWYLAGEAEIPNLINGKLPLEEQAKQAFNIRNQLRTEARELMADRAKAARLNIEEPNMTWEQVVEKYSKDGSKGDALWKKIIEGSQRSRQSVNKSLGVDTKKDK